MSAPECPKCRQKMEEGFIKDEGHGTVHPSKWAEGPAESSFWTGTKTRARSRLRS